MRKTKIVATVGPACASATNLRKLIAAGADMFRINTSHTSYEELRSWIGRIRKAKAQMPILVDLQGPRVRTGALKKGESIKLKKGAQILIRPSAAEGHAGLITTRCRQLPAMVKKGDPILLDNGIIHLKVLSVGSKGILCRVEVGGMLGENKGINLPNAPVTLPTLTANDRECLKIAARLKADYIALSFVRSAKDILTVKSLLKRYKSDIPVIAKIEKPLAFKHITPIIQAADALMVARGDLGIEMGIEKVPGVQKRLIELSKQHGVPIITATQMLESMIDHYHPTRAEVSDIANAVFDGTDALMLSGETSIGRYPVRTVKVMAQIAHEAERHTSLEPDSVPPMQAENFGSPIHAITRAAREASRNLGAKAIVVFTASWRTALLVSKLNTRARVIALTPSERVARRLCLLRGVSAIQMTYVKSTRQILRDANRKILQHRLLKKGDPIIVLSGKQSMPPGARYMVKIQFVGEV